MRRQIRTRNQDHEVTLMNRAGDTWMTVGEGPKKKVGLVQGIPGLYRVEVGDRSEQIEMVVKGETAYIKAFGRNFTLRVIDPVEQAVISSGSHSNSSRAPMPGVVVDVKVEAGEVVLKGQPLMTIESMKILTVIKSPRDGSVARIHLGSGQTFDKNA
ncbi:HlyD family efflux transporter periplasmic adaptor subunit, partial [bacterium]|nr:HlyD family efflux transporter periplasmic adaptor subunit [bacterium]